MAGNFFAAPRCAAQPVAVYADLPAARAIATRLNPAPIAICWHIQGIAVGISGAFHAVPCKVHVTRRTLALMASTMLRMAILDLNRRTRCCRILWTTIRISGRECGGESHEACCKASKKRGSAHGGNPQLTLLVVCNPQQSSKNMPLHVCSCGGGAYAAVSPIQTRAWATISLDVDVNVRYAGIDICCMENNHV
jgi:hypothetical protein